jgi:hypothetical protein
MGFVSSLTWIGFAGDVEFVCSETMEIVFVNSKLGTLAGRKDCGSLKMHLFQRNYLQN